MRKHLLPALIAFILLAIMFLASPSLLNSGVWSSAPPEENARGLMLVGSSSLDGKRYGDIWVHGQFAYLGTYSCGDGVKVVDVSNPATPQLANTLLTSSGSTYEDIAVIRANTRAFQGDLLAVGLQNKCRRDGPRGVQFWDVTNPRQPVELGFFGTGTNTVGVHELYLFQRGGRVFALLAVPGSERSGAGGDFRIVDATDPRSPRQIADWGAQASLGAGPTGRGGTTFCHSAWANDSGTVAYLSYWDNGVIILDIDNPSDPRLIGRTRYSPGEEGNAHSAWPVKGADLFLVTDEDFSIRGINVEITEPASMARQIFASEPEFAKSICAVGEMSSELVYVGRGCKKKNYPADVRGKVALMDGRGCNLMNKIQQAQKAQAIAAIIINNGSSLDLGGEDSSINIPGAVITAEEGEQVKSALTDGQAVRVRLSGNPNLNSWGYLRIYDQSDPTNPRQVGMFATDRSRQCPPPTPNAWYTVHNPFVVGNTAYLSWYAEGVRVLDISDPTSPREIAFYVPHDHQAVDDQGITPRHELPEQNSTAAVWGVYVQGDLIYLSDINRGIYVLRHS